MSSSAAHSGSNRKRILVCDDDPLFRKTVALALRDHGEIVPAKDSDEAVQLLQGRRFDLLLLDVQIRTPQEGISALGRIRDADADLAIVMLSGVSDFRVVREALQAGADDYLVKDADPEEFRLTIERALGKRRLERAHRGRNAEAARDADKYRLVGDSPALAETRRLAEKFRVASANVLITGETGTGKEIVARLLRKRDADGQLEPFVAVDSAALHASTAESLLFGHERGAFTGADRARRGLFEEADGGAVFFDEIANMPLAIQAKLLRVLQEKEVVRLGSHRALPLEFRVIAATNRPLETQVARGEFLPDLLQRLNVLPLSLPPLRERREDIPALVEHFLARKTGGRVGMTDLAREALALYEWPGNVRELSAMLDYSLALVEDARIDVADLHPKIRAATPARAEGGPPPAGADERSFYERMAEHEAILLREAYAKHGGNVSQMAARLGMDRSHLYTKLRQHGIRVAGRDG